MATVTICFEFTNGESDYSEFEAEGCLIGAITDYADDKVSELNDSREEVDPESDEIELDEWAVSDYDLDYESQQDGSNFSDLDAWADYCELVTEHGEGYALRYDDIGEFDYDDEYAGCWSSAEEFVQELIEDTCGIELPSYVYIDWERTAYDVMMDYSEYDGYDGTHIFRNC